LNKKDPHFKKLQAVWYGKLKEEGFVDIEDNSLSDVPLKQWSFNFFRMNYVPEKYEALKSYYDRANLILRTFNFQNEGYRQVWELHCQGFSERDIAKKISIYKKSAVHKIIAKILRDTR